MDGRETVIPKALATLIFNRLHYYHHGCDKMYTASKDIWLPMMHRNSASSAKFCKDCLEARKNLEPDIARANLEKTYVTTEPNEVVQLERWGPVSYIKGRKKYALIAVDVFSHWPLTSVCSKFLKNYIATNGHRRKLHMHQASGFFSKKHKNFEKTGKLNC